jgi:CRISPR-associated protein Cmr4
MSENPSNKPYERLRYFGLALDPIHVGSGGYRLGRVDMSIVREPGTLLPKIPGTSLAGACRAYAAMQENGKYPRCAGQGQAKGTNQGHCGQPDCPICVTFGFSQGEGGSFQGLAQFFDARLAFFPVYSLAGPVWVTCPMVLKDLGSAIQSNLQDHEVGVTSGIKHEGKLNLGWILLEVAKSPFELDGNLTAIPEDIKQRAVLVSDKLFAHIVNDNLEVRTSVSIDPQTGAAAEKALFTYEALPRASVVYLDIVVNHPRFYRIGDKIPLDGDMAKIQATVQKGLSLFEMLGIGGMNTRGMGRMQMILSPGGAS